MTALNRVLPLFSGTVARVARRALRALSGFIFAQLIIGAVSSFAWGAAVPAAAAAPLGWETVHAEGDDGMFVGARSRTESDGEFVFATDGTRFSIVFGNENWHLGRQSRFVPVSIKVDNVCFDGEAVVADRGGIVADVTPELLKAFADGSTATIDINRGDVVWTLDLHGFSAAMLKARNYFLMSSR
jgi:hypothetical protein